jgi:hypothetical protein
MTKAKFGHYVSGKGKGFKFNDPDTKRKLEKLKKKKLVEDTKHE